MYDPFAGTGTSELCHMHAFCANSLLELIAQMYSGSPLMTQAYLCGGICTCYSGISLLWTPLTTTNSKERHV